MAKKKERIINHIDQLNVEIDYDKLADAIVKANEKQSKQYSVSSEWMKFIITPVFWSVGLCSGLLAIAFAVTGAVEFVRQLNMLPAHTDWWQAIAGLVMIVLGMFLGSLCAFTVATAKEIDKEKDRAYVATMFSNIVALVALVVSLIALVKG